MPAAPIPILGRDIFAQMKTHVLIGHDPNLIMPETEIDLNVWADGGQVGRAQGAASVQIHLKPGATYPHQRQYPLHQETREGLSKMIGG
jgi:hypothetical protein